MLDILEMSIVTQKKCRYREKSTEKREDIPLPGFGNTFYYENMPNYLFSEEFKCPARVQWKHARVKGCLWVSSERACEM